MNQTQESAKQLADNAGFLLRQINTDGNDYPKGLGDYAAYDFSTFDEAEEFARMVDGQIILLHWKDGHSFARNKGTVDGPLKAESYIAKVGDSCSQVDLHDQRQWFQEVATGFILDGQTEQLRDLISEIESLENAFDSSDEHIVIRHEGTGTFDAVPPTMMSYTYDTNHYHIGVLLSRDPNETD